MELKKIRKYAIRKLTIGAVSAFVGSTVFGIGEGEIFAQENLLETELKNKNEEQKQKVEIKYLHISEDDLTLAEKKLLKNKNYLKNEIAIENESYILVYKNSEKKLPNTGLQDNNLSNLLALAGIATLVLLIRKNKNKVFITILAISTLTNIIPSHLTKALESELKARLIETYDVDLGNTLPEQKQYLGELLLTSYISEKDIPESTRLYNLLRENNALHEKISNNVEDDAKSRPAEKELLISEDNFEIAVPKEARKKKKRH